MPCRRPDRYLVWIALIVCFSPSRAFAQSVPPNEGSRARALSGYMDVQFTKPSDADGTLDFRRFVLLFAHRFSDRIRFVSELEVEHAIVEGGEDKGELE